MSIPAQFTRRELLGISLGVAGASLCGAPLSIRSARAADQDRPIDIGSRRELFADDFLITRLTGAKLRLHQPQPRDVAIVCDEPWEGNTSGYYTLFQDGDLCRMYYRGLHYDEKAKKAAHPQVTCYAESRDGLRWEKPRLGLVEFNGSRQNNIVWAGSGTHNFTPFKDANPACPPGARYKALGTGTTTIDGKRKGCLDAFQSPDGIHWTLMSAAVITAGAFDSQNLAFWDAVRGEYRAYWRISAAGARAIRTATSKDFIHWDRQADLTYVDSPIEHLYTNAVMPYFRAPHLFIAFPTRFQPKTQQVEPVFMTSRDGVLFRRWSEALIPITAPKDRDGNRSNYMTWGLLQLPGQDRELSVYATEAYYAGPGSRVRRFTFRTDGFVSAHAPAAGGELATRPLVFQGRRLAINFSASKGSLRVEIQDAQGSPLEGFRLADCPEIRGDEIERVVAWKSGSDVSRLGGRPIRLRMALKDADLFALRFTT